MVNIVQASFGKGNCVSEAAPQNVLLSTITVRSLHWGKVIRWLGRWTSLKSNTQMIEHTPTVKKPHTDETRDGACSKKGDTAGRVTSLLLRSHYLFHVKERAVDNLC